MKLLRKYWRAVRANYWSALLFDVLAIGLVFLLLHGWNTRHLLPPDAMAQAPNFQLASVDGGHYELSDYRDKRTILYFFSPSCHICNASMPNLQALYEREQEKGLQVFGIALDYRDAAEVSAFSGRHTFSFPVLLGGAQEIENYRIRGFPTYYVLDDAGSVEQRSVGYSTFIGLRWRGS